MIEDIRVEIEDTTFDEIKEALEDFALIKKRKVFEISLLNED